MKMFNPVPHTSQEQELKSFKKKKIGKSAAKVLLV